MDVLIVGAGIAGLRVGISVLIKNPKLKCCILEKYNYTGGRIITYHKNIPKIGPVEWENGAGRISISHKRVLKLLKKYTLFFQPISGDTMYNRELNKFTELLPIFLEPLEKLPKEVLQTHTIHQLLHKICPHTAKEFYIRFPYYSEIHVLRADIALNAFRNEMQTNAGFGVCREGFSALITCMVDEFESLGGIIIKNTEVTAILPNAVVCKNTENAEKASIFYTKACVLALHSDAVKHIIRIPLLKHLQMQPLLRMYAVFPVKGTSWFADIPKTVTDSPIRYIIPINPKKGIIMISYTEGKDAEYWMHTKNPEQKVMKEIRRLFPERSIPDPIFFKLHPWKSGTTYWLPGRYDIEMESYRALHPLPKELPALFMCGESFSVHQAWAESALEHADQLLEHPIFTQLITSHIYNNLNI